VSPELFIGHRDSPNLYAYVRNDPINRSDPSGALSIFCDVDGGCGSAWMIWLQLYGGQLKGGFNHTKRQTVDFLKRCGSGFGGIDYREAAQSGLESGLGRLTQLSVYEKISKAAVTFGQGAKVFLGSVAGGFGKSAITQACGI
jgi:uncharacterized protein RhaS with RHS repeats